MGGSCHWLTALKNSGLSKTFRGASVLLKMRFPPSFLLGAAWPFSSTCCSPSKHLLQIGNTRGGMAPDAHKCCFRKPEAVGFFPLVHSSNLGQWKLQWRQYKAQFLKVGKSTSLSTCQWLCILALNLVKGCGCGLNLLCGCGAFDSGLSCLCLMQEKSSRHAKRIFARV